MEGEHGTLERDTPRRTPPGVALSWPQDEVSLERIQIRCNAVHPRGVNTPTVQDVPDDTARQGYIPMGRRAAPEEIASGVLSLTSDASSCMAGSEMVIDEGANRKHKRSFCAGLSGVPEPRAPLEPTGARAGHVSQEGEGEDPPGVERAERPGTGGWGGQADEVADAAARIKDG